LYIDNVIPSELKNNTSGAGTDYPSGAPNNITNVEGICDYLMTDGILDTGLQDTILVIMKRKVKH
jgi:hypothetical protein